jgi:hypothetical protein
MAHEVHEYHDAMHDCPKCGKRALTHLSAGHFNCIWCGFKRNVSDREHSYMGVDGSVAGGIVMSLLLVFLVSLARPSEYNPTLDRSIADVPFRTTVPVFVAPG